MSKQNFVILSDADEIVDYLAGRLEAKISAKIEEAVERATAKRYLTSKEVRELTGFSARKLHYLRTGGSLSFVQHGNSILYPTESVFKFLEAHRVRGGK